MVRQATEARLGGARASRSRELLVRGLPARGGRLRPLRASPGSGGHLLADPRRGTGSALRHRDGPRADPAGRRGAHPAPRRRAQLAHPLRPHGRQRGVRDDPRPGLGLRAPQRRGLGARHGGRRARPSGLLRREAAGLRRGALPDPAFQGDRPRRGRRRDRPRRPTPRGAGSAGTQPRLDRASRPGRRTALAGRHVLRGPDLALLPGHRSRCVRAQRSPAGAPRPRPRAGLPVAQHAGRRAGKARAAGESLRPWCVRAPRRLDRAATASSSTSSKASPS